MASVDWTFVRASSWSVENCPDYAFFHAHTPLPMTQPPEASIVSVGKTFPLFFFACAPFITACPFIRQPIDASLERSGLVSFLRVRHFHVLGSFATFFFHDEGPLPRQPESQRID